MQGPITRHDAEAFIAGSRFLWHQRFDLAPGVRTPGASDVAFLLDQAGIPGDLSGRSVLDIGTSNGGCAFELERRGAARVVAVDLYPPDHFGFSAIAALLRSRVEFVEASIYELPERLDGERFDLVLCFGVLYHLRHPLLALDRIRDVAAGEVYIETAVCDYESPALAAHACARFYRGGELAGDPSNWFAPSVKALLEWMPSCGLDVVRHATWPVHAPERAMVAGVRTAGPAEFETISYERRLRAIQPAPLVRSGRDGACRR